MSDHISGPRAIADPVIDITDVYAFPCPESPKHLVLVMNVFPYAGPTARYSDAVTYRLRVRSVSIAEGGRVFAVAAEESVFDCTFSGAQAAQEGRCTLPAGEVVAFRVNDQSGGRGKGVQIFAGQRSDPFFLDGPMAERTIGTRKLAFKQVGSDRLYGKNVLGIVLRMEWATVLKGGPMFAVVGETLTAGKRPVRLERVGRPEMKNVTLSAKMFDTINRDLEIRDLYNDEDAFNLSKHYVGAYRARFNANLAFYDGLDDKVDWPLDAQGNHPLTELLLADFLVVDASKPFSETSFFEIERAMLAGRAHETCGGRWLNEDLVDSLLTLYINAGNGPRTPRRRRRADCVVREGVPLHGAAESRGDGSGMIDQRPLTDGTIAMLNLGAQIDAGDAEVRLGCATVETRAGLVELIALRGQIIGQIADYDWAEEIAEELVRAAPVDARALIARARARATFHRFNDALADLEHAEQLSIDPEMASGERAAVFQAVGRYDEALALREEAVDRRASFENVAALASLHAERGEIDAAERRFAESRSRYRGVSPFPLALLDFQRGRMWMDEGRLREARDSFEAAQRAVPAYAPARGHLAEVEAQLGDIDSAVARLRPLAASSDDPDYAAQLANILGGNGRDGESRRWRRLAAARYEELVARRPEAFADHAAEFWLAAGADPDEALRLAKINAAVRDTPRARRLLAQTVAASAQ